MKKIFFIPAGIILLWMIPSLMNAQLQKNETVSIRTRIYCDHCLHCESCSARIIRFVYAVKGTKKASVNPKEELITVTFDPGKTSLVKIREAVNAAGFEADDSKPTAEAVQQLDGCCRKSN